MPALSKTARKMMDKIGKSCGKKKPVQFHRGADGRYYVADGREIKGAGLYELLDSGIFVPQEDGLFPGFTQTFTLNTANL